MESKIRSSRNHSRLTISYLQRRQMTSPLKVLAQYQTDIEKFARIYDLKKYIFNFCIFYKVT